VVDGITTVRRASRPIGGGNFAAPVNVDTVVTTRFRAEGVTPRIVAAAGQVRVAYSRGEANAVAAKSVAGNGVDQSIPTTGFPFNVQAGIDRAGALVLGWDQVVPNQFVDGVFGARLPASDTTAGSTLLSRPGRNSTLDALAVGADGTAIALPDLRDDSSSDDQSSQVQASFLAPGGVFGDREEVSGLQDRVGSGRFDPAVGAIGSDGRAFAAWAADDGSGAVADRVFLSERDATAPVLSGITVPAGAVSGTPLAFAASASDALSPVTLTWDFGDGSHARGGLVGHTYGAPGTYTVTLTARDGAGNVATESRTVVISPVPSAGGDGGPGGPDRTAPKLTGLKSAHPTFRVGSRATSVVAARKKSPAGTTFTLNVDERSTLVLSFRGKAGHKRLTVPGVIVRGGRGPGAVSIPFSGRVGSTRLKPGSYVASLTAIDGAGNRSRSATVSFKVVSR
jgi:hypothetical protein